jgi:hypothetical protein
VLTFCQWLENTSLGVYVREAPYAFQVLAGVHILGLALSVGTFIWFDLRLLGVSMTGSRVSDLYRRLMPWATVGFVSMFTTGGILFIGYAPATYGSIYFRTKMIALALAGANALFYHAVTERRLAEWDRDPRPIRAARMAGLVSIALWTTVILCGRMMSYTIF